MDTPDEAAKLADPKLADVLNRSWLLKSSESHRTKLLLGSLNANQARGEMSYQIYEGITATSDEKNGFDEQHGRLSLPDETGRKGGRFRLLLAGYLLLGITLSIYSRSVLSLAAVSMVASNVAQKELIALLSSAIGNQTRLLSRSTEFEQLATPSFVSSLDGSCPVAKLSTREQAMMFGSGKRALQRRRLELQLQNSIERRIELGELVDWTPGEQGLIFAAGSAGNLLLAIPLSRLGELHGAKWVIFVALWAGCLQAALMPLLASSRLIIILLFQFIFNGLTFGADCVVYTLYANWLTPIEMAFFVACLLICHQLGGIVSSASTAFLLAQRYHWQWCFYLPAALCGLWALIWAILGSSEPDNSRFISPEERHFLSLNSKLAQQPEPKAEVGGIISDRGSKEARRSSGDPIDWRKFFSDPNIWAIIAVKFSLRWYFSVYLSLMPTYLASVSHLSIESIGRISVFQSVLGLISGILLSYTTKSVLAKRPFNWSLPAVRKIFQSTVNFGIALSLLAFALFDCNTWVSIASLTIGGICANFYVAGALQLPLDLSPANCGLITSVTNTLAPGQALGAPLSGLILNQGPKDRFYWRQVWFVSILLNSASGLLFLVLVDSKPRDYRKTRTTGRESES